MKHNPAITREEAFPVLVLYYDDAQSSQHPRGGISEYDPPGARPTRASASRALRAPRVHLSRAFRAASRALRALRAASRASRRLRALRVLRVGFARAAECMRSRFRAGPESSQAKKPVTTPGTLRRRPQTCEHEGLQGVQGISRPLSPNPAPWPSPDRRHVQHVLIGSQPASVPVLCGTAIKQASGSWIARFWKMSMVIWRTHALSLYYKQAHSRQQPIPAWHIAGHAWHWRCRHGRNVAGQSPYRSIHQDKFQVESLKKIFASTLRLHTCC